MVTVHVKSELASELYMYVTRVSDSSSTSHPPTPGLATQEAVRTGSMPRALGAELRSARMLGDGTRGPPGSRRRGTKHECPSNIVPTGCAGDCAPPCTPLGDPWSTLRGTSRRTADQRSRRRGWRPPTILRMPTSHSRVDFSRVLPCTSCHAAMPSCVRITRERSGLRARGEGVGELPRPSLRNQPRAPWHCLNMSKICSQREKSFWTSFMHWRKLVVSSEQMGPEATAAVGSPGTAAAAVLPPNM